MKRLFLLSLMVSFAVGCSQKTITTKSMSFGPYTDPFFEDLMEYCEEVDVKDASFLTSSWGEDCRVSVGIEPVVLSNLSEDSDECEIIQVAKVKVFDNNTKGVLYERSLSYKSGHVYETQMRVYNPAQGYVICEFIGDVVIPHDLDKVLAKDFNLKEMDCMQVLNMYRFYSINDSQLKFYKLDPGMEDPRVSQVVLTEDNQISVTEYWSNGQTRINKEYEWKTDESGDSDYWLQLVDASTFTEDGNSGNPMEVAVLFNDRWVGFSSSLYNKWSGKYLYLVLRSDEDDWRYGKAVFCFSGSECQEDFVFEQKGNYEIDSSNHIRLYNMKDSRGNSKSECRFSISGSAKWVNLKGEFSDFNTTFVSDVDMRLNWWFRDRMESKYRMY